MKYFTTALGRLVPEDEVGTLLEDLVLRVLFDYRMNPFNASNSPMPVSSLSQAAQIDKRLAGDVAEALVKKGLVEKPGPSMGEDAYRVTGGGVVYMHNVPQGLAGVL